MGHLEQCILFGFISVQESGKMTISSTAKTVSNYKKCFNVSHYLTFKQEHNCTIVISVQIVLVEVVKVVCHATNLQP